MSVEASGVVERISWPVRAFGASGASSADQVAPFCVRIMPAQPFEPPKLPMATQSPSTGHETASRSFSAVVGSSVGTGPSTAVQVPPSKISRSGRTLFSFESP